VGNTLTGVTPNLPELAALHEAVITTAIRDNSYNVTINTAAPHGFLIGEQVKVQNVVPSVNTIGLRVEVLTTDTDVQVAVKTANAINTLLDISAVQLGNVVTTTNNSNVSVNDATDIDAGVGIIVTQQGTVAQPEITDITTVAGAALDGLSAQRWEISSSATKTYHIWYDVIDGINTQVDPAMTDPNGTFTITDIPSPTQFVYVSGGNAGTGTGGVCRVERIGMKNSESLVYYTSARLDTGILGPIIWDLNASFVLSSLTANIQSEIKAGNNVRTLQIDPINNIPDEEGFVIFGFGTEFQEGPVRYFFKPTDASMQLDPAYVFEFNHDIGDAVTVIRRRGGHVMSRIGTEYGAYITDPSVAREVLQNLILSVKSVGIFIEFLIRFPEQLYATLDVYKSCRDDRWPVTEEDRADCE
jgi:hypothetical protein